MPGSEKSDGAFRTIREVADWLAVPTHVLRFWESKFDQIAPVKGAGGRRYYRPDDMRLLGGIKVMLHDQGLTVRGVSQKIDDDGVAAVMALSPDLDAVDTPPQRTRRVIRSGNDSEVSQVVPFDRNKTPDETPRDAPGTPEQPDAPGEESLPPQPIDVGTPPQPVDIGPQESVSAPAPEPEIKDLDIPGEDPTPVPTDERGITPPPAPAPVEPAPQTASPRAARPPLDALQKRRLRRILLRLRTLVEDVEGEMAEGGPH